MAEENNTGADTWGTTVDAPFGPAPPAAMSPARSAILEGRSRVGRVQTAAVVMVEAKAAATMAGLVDDGLVTSLNGGDMPQTTMLSNRAGTA